MRDRAYDRAYSLGDGGVEVTTTLVRSDEVYQATDLARRSREVMDAAHRPGGALIRDKDGTPFLLAPAAASRLEHFALVALRSMTRAFIALQQPRQTRDSLLYGDLVWLAVLPDEDQRTFIGEYARAVEAVDATGVDPVEQLVYEWRQTARAWADEDLREQLMSSDDEPLTDTEL